MMIFFIRIRVHRLTDFRLHPNEKQENKSDGTKTRTEPKTVIFKGTVNLTKPKYLIKSEQKQQK